MIFAVLVASFVFCQSGEPVKDDKCDDGPVNKVEMFLLTGSGDCPDFDCASSVSELLRIERNGKVLLSVPADSIDRDTLDKMWLAMKPIYNHTGPIK